MYELTFVSAKVVLGKAMKTMRTVEKAATVVMRCGPMTALNAVTMLSAALLAPDRPSRIPPYTWGKMGPSLVPLIALQQRRKVSEGRMTMAGNLS